MQKESEIDIECKVFRTCNCIKRLIFIMSHFDEWCRKNDIKKVCKGLSMNDIIQSLPHYDIVQLWNDFIHAKKCHFLSENNKQSMLEAIQVWEYVESKLGQQSMDNCSKFARNNRNRGTYKDKAQRQALYYGFTDCEEIVCIQLCDVIWEFLFHSKTLFKNEYANKILFDAEKLEKAHNDSQQSQQSQSQQQTQPTIVRRKSSHRRSMSKSRIAKQMLQRLEKQKEKEKAAAIVDGNAEEEPVEEFKYSEEDKQQFEEYISLKHRALTQLDLNKKQSGKNGDDNDDDGNVLKSKFVTNVYDHNLSVHSRGISFGVSFVYWKGYSSYTNYIKTATYSTLKEELLNNPFYRLSMAQWHDTLIKAIKFNATHIGRKWMAKNAGILNRRYGIHSGLPISTAHIMSLLFYVNFKDLQYAFKTNGCRKFNKKESMQSVKERNKNIGNWYKLFTECITLYGDITNETQIFYHGLDKRILLNAFTPNFNCMISTTSSLSVAQSIILNDNNGIIIKLQQKTSLPYGYLDVEWMSDFQNEGEKIFSFSKLDVVDIYQNKPTFQSNTIYVKSLILFQSIVKGHYFQHTLHPNLTYQRVIIAMIEAWMHANSEADVDEKDNEDDSYETDIKIPSYMQELFNSFVAKMEKICVIRSQFDHLFTTLKAYLIDFDQDGSYEFGTFLVALKTKHQNVLKLTLMKEYRWHIAGDTMTEFKALPINNTIKGKYFHAGNEVVLYPRLRRSDRDFPDKSMMFCYVEEMPSNYTRIYIQWDLFCKETNYHSSQTRFLKRREFAGYTVSNTQDLCNLNEFTFEIAVQILKFETS